MKVHCIDLENESLVRDWVRFLPVKSAQSQLFRASPNPASFTTGCDQWGCKLTESKPEGAGSVLSSTARRGSTAQDTALHR